MRTPPHQARLLAPTRPEEELYDLEGDPYDVENLASEPAYHDTLERMRGELETWMDVTDDQGRFPEAPEVIQYWEDRMHEVYGDVPGVFR